MDDDQIMLDPNSIIGMFIRRCLLTFNQMSFEVIICNIISPIEHVDGRTLSLSSNVPVCVWVGGFVIVLVNLLRRTKKKESTNKDMPYEPPYGK